MLRVLLLIFLCGCVRDPTPPVVAVDTGWWRGTWTIDVARVDALNVPPRALEVLLQIAPTSRFWTRDGELVRKYADVERVDRWQLRTVNASRADFQAADQIIVLELGQDGVWLVDGDARLPLVAVDDSTTDAPDTTRVRARPAR